MNEESEIRHVVELNNVFVKSTRGGEVFHDLNFKLAAGSSAVIHGAAGSGKSTLAELLIGRRFADGGSVAVFEQVLQPGKKSVIRRVRRKVGGVGGIFTLAPSFNVAENIELPLVISGVRKRVRKERLLRMLTEFSLIKQATEYPENLTRVENTLVQFARATVADQPLIIIDEPLAGLDQKTYQRIFGYLVKMAVSGSSLIILTGEEIPADIPHTNRFTIMNGGLV